MTPTLQLSELRGSDRTIVASAPGNMGATIYLVKLQNKQYLVHTTLFNTRQQKALFVHFWAEKGITLFV